MNLPNKLTLLRICLIPVFVILMLSQINNFFLIACIVFMVASITDFLDGHLARKYNNVSDYGKLMDPIADKLSVNSLLIILSAYGYIHPVIPVIVVMRDMIVNTIRLFANTNGEVVPAGYTGKFKTAFLMIGLMLKLFSNFPFAFINVAVDDFFLIAGTILSLISGFEYYEAYKKYLFKRQD